MDGTFLFRAISDAGIAVVAGGVLVLLFIHGYRSQIMEAQKLVEIIERQNNRLLDRILRGDGNGGAGLGQLQEAVRDLDQRVYAIHTLLKTRPCVLELPCPPVAVEERIRKVTDGGN